jgi:hypothetical protein
MPKIKKIKFNVDYRDKVKSFLNYDLYFRYNPKSAFQNPPSRPLSSLPPVAAGESLEPDIGRQKR